MAAEILYLGNTVSLNLPGMVWYGMTWLGMAWHGLVRFGMVWYGLAKTVALLKGFPLKSDQL